MQFISIVAYIFGGLFIAISIAVLVVNVIGFIKDIKKKKNQRKE